MKIILGLAGFEPGPSGSENTDLTFCVTTTAKNISRIYIILHIYIFRGQALNCFLIINIPECPASKAGGIKSEILIL